MEISSLLSNDAVKVVASATSKKRLFQALGETAESCYGLCAKTAVEALQERENLGPTGVGNGIALPHARLAGLDRVLGVFLKLEKPLEFGAVDRKPVDLIFALFAPESSGVKHLKALAAASRVLRNDDICQKLRGNNSADTLHAILTELEESRAA